MSTIMLALVVLGFAGNLIALGFLFVLMNRKDEIEQPIKRVSTDYEEKMRRKELELMQREEEMKRMQREKEEAEEERFRQQEIEREEAEEKHKEDAFLEEQRKRLIEEEERIAKENQFNFKENEADNFYERFDVQAKYDEDREYKMPMEDEKDEVVIEIQDVNKKDTGIYQIDPSNTMLERNRNKNKERKTEEEVFKKEETKEVEEEDWSKFFGEPVEIEKTEEEKAKQEVNDIISNLDNIKRSEEELEGYRKQNVFSEEERKSLEYGEKTLFEIKENKLNKVEEKESDIDLNIDIDQIHEKYYGKKEKAKRELFEEVNMEKELPDTVFEKEEKKKEEQINIKELEPSKYMEKEDTETIKIEEVNENEMDKRIKYLMDKMNKGQ